MFGAFEYLEYLIPKLVEHSWQLHSFIFIHTKQILSMESGSSRRPPQHTKITMGNFTLKLGGIEPRNGCFTVLLMMVGSTIPYFNLNQEGCFIVQLTPEKRKAMYQIEA